MEWVRENGGWLIGPRRYSPVVPVAFCMFVVADLIFSVILIGGGSSEINPIMAAMFDQGIVPATVLKVVSIGAGIGLWILRSKALPWLVWIYGILVAYEVALLVLL